MQMKAETIKRAVELGTRVGYVFIATADSEGLPHMAASRKIAAEREGIISIREWFCPGTLANIRKNPRLSVVVWDQENDVGYQILGNSEKIEDLYMMNGLAPDAETQENPFPQVERKILIAVNKIVRFCHAPHSDVEE